MRRFRLDALAENDGVAFYAGEPFTGIAYDVAPDGTIPNVYNYVGGVRIGPHICPWTDGLGRCLADVAGELRVAGATTPDGKQYEAVYEFVHGYLREEYVMFPADDIQYRFWDPGEGLFEMRKDGLTKCWTWGRGLVSINNSTGFSVAFEKDGNITRLLADGANFPRPGVDYTPTVAHALDLVGIYVDDDLVYSLFGLERLRIVELRRTSITEVGLRAFEACAELEKLVIHKNKCLTLDDFRQLVDKLPGCVLEEG